MALAAALARTYRLTPAQARIAAKLYEATGPVAAYDLAEAVIHDDALADGSNALKAHLHNVRGKLSPGSIETISDPDTGRPGKPPAVAYRLTDEGRALIWTALRVADPERAAA